MEVCVFDGIRAYSSVSAADGATPTATPDRKPARSECGIKRVLFFLRIRRRPPKEAWISGVFRISGSVSCRPREVERERAASWPSVAVTLGLLNAPQRFVDGLEIKRLSVEGAPNHSM